MSKPWVYKEEQVKLIMECRTSGLSDYQWCKSKDINPGTFYNWISRLRKQGYNFPESSGLSHAAPADQEVIKLDVITYEPPEPEPSEGEQNTRSLAVSQNSSPLAAELNIHGNTVRLYCDAPPELIKTIFACLGGGTHAW